MDGCGLKKICFIYRYYHTYLLNFRFVYLFLIGCRMTVLHFSGVTFLASDR